MSRLIHSLLSDARSGVRIGSHGQRYFRPRHVRFETISIDARDLHRGDWLEYREPVEELNWMGSPNHRELLSFAAQSSDRFLSFWYRVFDVAVARAINGSDTRIFRVAFMRPTAFFDIGIPEDQTQSSIPPLLHEKIMKEYRASQATPSNDRVFYLSNYLEGLTDDVRRVLAPFHRLWDLKESREDWQTELQKHYNRLLSVQFESGVHALLSETIDRAIVRSLDRLARSKGERGVEDRHLRALIFARRNGERINITEAIRSLCLKADNPLGVPAVVLSLYRALELPHVMYRLARSAAGHAAAVYRLDLRLCKLAHYHRNSDRTVQPDSILARRDRMEELFQRRSRELATLIDSRDTRALLTAMRLLSRTADGKGRADLIAGWPNETEHNIAPEAETEIKEDLKAAQAIGESIESLRETNASILELYRNYEQDETVSVTDDRDARYVRAEQLLLDDLVTGSPYDEHEILKRARTLLIERLRPIRRTTNFYSLVAGDRHGAIPLNPVMKLWKDRPYPAARDSLHITSLEINTRETARCLMHLARHVDPRLSERVVYREKILREKRGDEDLSNMNVFLVPGSCYPIREVHRLDFPEFRGRVIGENRTPTELGVDRTEDAILTGGWYQKYNHSLYYPVGGDNGRLITIIRDAQRAPSVPAFFFALGQFAHDCLQDEVIYYRASGGSTTFRECVEDYYLLEDRIRKNRGERFGRRRIDNSRAGIRFMFAIIYSRLMMEALTGSSQTHFRHPATENWMHDVIGLPLIRRLGRSELRALREGAREIIAGYDQD